MGLATPTPAPIGTISTSSQCAQAPDLHDWHRRVRQLVHLTERYLETAERMTSAAGFFLPLVL